MNITKLDLYKVFCQVAKCQSFSKGAQELYMTQPAVSQSIMQLERELDTRLFTRTSRGVILTNEGKILFEYISSGMNLIRMGEKKLLEAKNLMTGELKIGVGDTISRYFLLPHLEKFHNLYPNIKFKIMNRTTLELSSLLKAGEIEIALGNLPIEEPAFEVRKCLDVHDIFVCGEKYLKELPQPLDFEAMSALPLILLEQNSNSRKYLEKYMLAKGIKLKPEIELGSHELLLEFARINLGVACVIKEFAKEYLENKQVYEVKTTEIIPPRYIGFCFLKGVSLSPASKRFIEIVETKDRA